jgi:hypothetical protein
MFSLLYVQVRFGRFLSVIIPNWENTYQMTIKYTKSLYSNNMAMPQNFHFKAFRNKPKLGFLVAIWQPWFRQENIKGTIITK